MLTKVRLFSAVLLLSVLVVFFTGLFMSALSTYVVREVNMYLLAVGGSKGSYRGVATLLKVGLIPGDGAVYLSIDPLSELDMQSSLKMASLIASFITGFELSNYSVLVRIQSNTPIVGGPSAGAALTTALTALFSNSSLNESVVVTGMIMPDTLVGPVGGIPEKLEAAASVGAKMMVIPAGQRISVSLKTGSLVDVVEAGKSLGVVVVEASTIYDVLKYFGISVSLPDKPNISLGTEVENAFKSVTDSYRFEYDSLYTNVSNDFRSYSGSLRRAGVNDDVARFLDYSRSSALRGEEAYNFANYYAAASDYFGALVYVWTAKFIIDMVVRGRDWSDILGFVSEEVSRTSEYFGSLVSGVRSESVGVSSLSVLVELAGRVYESRAFLKQLSSVGTPTINNVYEAAYTYMRARSVYGWGTVYQVLEGPDLSVDMDSLRSGTEVLLSFSRASVTYLQSLLGSSVNTSRLTNYLDVAESFLSSGGLNNTLVSLSLVLKASSYASIETHLSFEVNTSLLVSRLSSAARQYIGLAESLGVKPVVSLVYLERGLSLAGVDDSSAAYFLDQAILNSMWYLILSRSRISFNLTETPSSTPEPGWGVENYETTWYYVLAVVVVSAVSGALLGYLSSSRKSSKE
ncbi:MAG: S16 family serine protease [Desulfurococcaceae archaeon TW002]